MGTPTALATDFSATSWRLAVGVVVWWLAVRLMRDMERVLKENLGTQKPLNVQQRPYTKTTLQCSKRRVGARHRRFGAWQHRVGDGSVILSITVSFWCKTLSFWSMGK
jgi:hypothetical protein